MDHHFLLLAIATGQIKTKRSIYWTMLAIKWRFSRLDVCANTRRTSIYQLVNQTDEFWKKKNELHVVDRQRCDRITFYGFVCTKTGILGIIHLGNSDECPTWPTNEDRALYRRIYVHEHKYIFIWSASSATCELCLAAVVRVISLTLYTRILYTCKMWILQKSR